jgi:hypothetical protein
MALRQSGSDDGHIDLGGATSINTTGFCGGDPFGLALPAEISLKLGKDPKHVEEGFAGSCRRIHWLLSRRQVRSLLLQQGDDALQVTQAPRKAIYTRYDQRLAGMDEVEDSFQFQTSVKAGTTLLLRSDHTAPSRFQRSHLGIHVLIRGRGARIGVDSG